MGGGGGREGGVTYSSVLIGKDATDRLTRWVVGWERTREHQKASEDGGRASQRREKQRGQHSGAIRAWREDLSSP